MLLLTTSWLTVALAATEGDWTFKRECLTALIEAVPAILASQDAATGRFGSGIWIVNDQNVLFPLAVAWATKDAANPYYHSEELLTAIMAGGDALIDDQDEQGRWEFRKKDGSTWGPIYMPWTYSRWIRAFGLVREAMPPDRRERWEKALRLGFEGIARTCLGNVHNIPAHHAMALYHAGQLFRRPEWQRQAREFLGRVCTAQDEGGFWSEHLGPVVNYNFVYSEALGIYFALSGDESVLPALRRAALFHANFTYPDGSSVETVDERNPYHAGISLGNVGFTFTPEGRGFLLHQMALLQRSGQKVDADTAASLVLYGQEGPVEPPPSEKAEHRFVLGDNKAFIRRTGPWFVALSAYVCPVPQNRWIQDRQNFVSLYHDRTGLILGGGNTKLQPLWSTFTVGDVTLLSPTPGDENPNFIPPEGLRHVPEAAELSSLDPPTLRLRYGPEECRVTVQCQSPVRAVLTYQATVTSGQPVAAHVTLLPHLGERLTTANGQSFPLGDKAISLAPGDAGAWIAHHGWRLMLPPEAAVVWPALPHNPYRKDGHATSEEGRLVVTLPFSAQRTRYEIVIEIPQEMG